MVLYSIPEALMGTMIGFAGGIVLGLAAQIGRFCTLGAIEDALYGQSNNRLRMWGTAIGMAVLLVQYSPQNSTELAARTKRARRCEEPESRRRRWRE